MENWNSVTSKLHNRLDLAYLQQSQQRYLPNESFINKLRNNRTNSTAKSGKIIELHNKIDTVNNYIRDKHDITPFIYFKVNDFELDTRDADSFKHFAVSMENQKTGVGQGNQFKIKIAYHKDFSNFDYLDSNNINRLELALTQTRQISLFAISDTNNNMENIRNLKGKNNCILQYGYIDNTNNLISPQYIGKLLKYTVKANKQIVEYTLEGFTGESIAVNTINWYPNIVRMNKNKVNIYNKTIEVEVAPQSSGKTMSKEERDDYIQKIDKEYSGGITMNPYLALDAFLQDYNNSVDDNSTRFFLVDCTNNPERGELKDSSTLQSVALSLCRGQTPIQYIEYCIGLFKYQSTDYSIEFLKQKLRTSERFVYTLVSDPDNSNKIYICIDVINDLDSDEKVAYSFTGYSEDNSLLIDYDLNYDGSVSLAIADIYSGSDNEEDKHENYFIDKDGSLKKQVSITRDMFISTEIDDILISKQNSWLDKISCANNCTMTTFGLPFEISVGTVFKCGMYITDTLHHTSGNCYITSITDKIENNKFTSVFNMIRLPGKNSALEEITV